MPFALVETLGISVIAFSNETTGAVEASDGASSPTPGG
jgi:hypothetical protein